MDRSVVDARCAERGRGAGTAAERRAAAGLHDELRARGEEAFVEARWVRPQRQASIAAHAALAVVAAALWGAPPPPPAHAALAGAAALRPPALPLPAAIAAGVAALSLAIEATGRAAPLSL